MAQGVSPRQALDALVQEELLAQEALRTLDPAALDDARWRARIQTLLTRAVEAPNTPQTIAPAVHASAFEQLRPEFAPGARRVVVHALFEAPVNDTAARLRAHHQATSFRDALIAALGPRPSREAFAARAEATPGARFESLSPFEVTGDVGGGTSYVQPFVDAAFALSLDAPVSAPTETTFGVHVLLLLETLPASPRIEEETRALVQHRLVTTLRAQTLRRLLDRLRARTRVETDATAVMRLPRTSSP